MRDKVLKYLELTDQAKMVDQLIPHLLDSFRRGYESDGTKFTAAESAVLALMESALRASAHEMLDAMASLYEEHFTEADMDALVAFYGTPAGRRAVALQPVLLGASKEISAAWAQRVMGGIQPEIERLLDGGGSGCGAIRS